MATAYPPRNRLGSATSPYLRQHAGNPVDWWPWGNEALAEARATGRPILLSIGYAACHWCHVMAHESFEDPVIAAQMNELFVNIKLDREERPDLDQIYQAALALMGQAGGWPLTMFLTPEGEPFWGGTYFPPRPSQGRPGLPQVLEAVSRIYHGDPARVQQNTRSLMEGLQRQHRAANPQTGEAPAEIPFSLIDRIADRLAAAIDPVAGGLQGAPKFPQVPILELLWRAHNRQPDGPYGQAVIVSITRMAQGGIYDHLGGGFARYATDTEWLVPHFEKMLYDNALLIGLMTEIWTETRAPLLAARIAETIDWLTRELLLPEGGFAASLDADSDGVEGRFYVWTEAEIDRLLGVDAPVFKQAYAVSPNGNWEGHTILNRGMADELSEHEPDLVAARARLLAARADRARPARDDKLLADWNGLVLLSLVRAGVTFDRPEWIALARRSLAALTDLLTDAEGRLHHSWCAGSAAHPAILDDYANLAMAAVALYEAEGHPADLEQAESWVALLDRHYWDDDRGGYFLTADDTPDLILRPRHASDGAVPSGNGIMAGLLTRLHLLTGRIHYADQAAAIIAAFAGGLAENLVPLAGLLNTAALAQRPVLVTILGKADDPATRALIRAAWSAPCPDRIVQPVPDTRPLPADHPAKHLHVNGGAAAYVCIGRTCSLPIKDPVQLSALLTRSRP